MELRQGDRVRLTEVRRKELGDISYYPYTGIVLDVHPEFKGMVLVRWDATAQALSLTIPKLGPFAGPNTIHAMIHLVEWFSEGHLELLPE